MCSYDDLQFKQTGKGIQSALTEDGKLIMVVDTMTQVGTSKNNNPLYALTNGISGTPFGEGLFLTLLVGRDMRYAPKQQQEQS